MADMLLPILASDPAAASAAGACSSSCTGGGCASGRAAGAAPDGAGTRRDFLKNATTLALGAMSLTLLPAAATLDAPLADAGAPGPAGASGGKTAPVWGFLVDTTKCTGAGKCLTACRVENDVPEGQSRTWEIGRAHV